MFIYINGKALAVHAKSSGVGGLTLTGLFVLSGLLGNITHFYYIPMQLSSLFIFHML